MKRLNTNQSKVNEDEGRKVLFYLKIKLVLIILLFHSYFTRKYTDIFGYTNFTAYTGAPVLVLVKVSHHF